jgi:hypothetical protein
MLPDRSRTAESCRDLLGLRRLLGSRRLRLRLRFRLQGFRLDALGHRVLERLIPIRHRLLQWLDDDLFSLFADVH